MQTHSNQDLRNAVQPARVNRRLYTDPAIFELEMERIFGVAWRGSMSGTKAGCKIPATHRWMVWRLRSDLSFRGTPKREPGIPRHVKP